MRGGGGKEKKEKKECAMKTQEVTKRLMIKRLNEYKRNHFQTAR